MRCTCGRVMQQVEGRYGEYLRCTGFPACDRTCQPGGKPTDSPTRKARIAAHEAFDPLWKDGGRRARGRAYKWLADAMKVKIRDCHISRFTKGQCERVITLCAGLTEVPSEKSHRGVGMAER